MKARAVPLSEIAANGGSLLASDYLTDADKVEELDRQAELDKESRLTEAEDFSELAELEPESRQAFDGNRYLGLKSPHES